MNGWITIGTKLDTKQFDVQIQQLEKDLEQMEASYSSGRKMGFAEDEEDLQKLAVEIEKTKNKLIQLRRQKEKTAEPSNIDRMKDAFKNVGNTVGDTIKRVSKLVLGVFAIRSAYLAVRRASSELASYDSQYAANIEYIRYALTQMIAPVLRWIVQMAATLLNYINLIVNSLFGINLFSKGSAESFNKMKASAGGVSKAVKEIKKQLAGFDEINVLTDESDTGTSAGGGGVGTPSFDLSEMVGEKPKWFDEILPLIAGIVAGLLAIKLGFRGIQALGIGIAVYGLVKLIKDIIKFIKNPSWKKFSNILKDISLILAGIALLLGGQLGVKIGAVAAAIAGIAIVIDGVVDYLKDPTWENFITILGGLALIVAAVALAFGGLPALITAIIGLVAALGLAIYKNWDKIKETMSKVGKWINDNVITPIANFFTWLWQKLKDGWNGFWTSVGYIIDNVAIWIYNKVIKPVTDFFVGLWNNLKTGASNAWEGIKSVFSTVANFFKTIFTNAWEGVKRVFSTGGKIFDGIKEGIVSAFKTIVNAIIRGINKVVSIPFNSINNMLSKIKNVSILGAKPFNFIHTISVPQIPTLKTGGIINMPNRGTMIGGMAIGGEAGREGVVPLTDQQAMAELGREIGKNVLVNLTNITSMNGRVISRELKNIQSENDFAYNN